MSHHDILIEVCNSALLNSALLHETQQLSSSSENLRMTPVLRRLSVFWTVRHSHSSFLSLSSYAVHFCFVLETEPIVLIEFENRQTPATILLRFFQPVNSKSLVSQWKDNPKLLMYVDSQSRCSHSCRWSLSLSIWLWRKGWC